VTRSIEWYYGDKGRIVGPMSFEEVAGRINRARNEKHLVWTEGMARWADAKTVPAFTDLFRANLPPLPALALSSLSSEDEIVWIKLGSRATPPMLPVLRVPPVWRHEPSAIWQTLSDASPQGEQQPWQWRREVKHLGSTGALFLGGLAFIGAASRIGNGDPVAPGVLKAGLVLIVGALVYRSAKRRRLGEVASASARRALEGIAIVLMFLSVLLL
jgi:GYF domain 2